MTPHIFKDCAYPTESKSTFYTFKTTRPTSNILKDMRNKPENIVKYFSKQAQLIRLRRKL